LIFFENFKKKHFLKNQKKTNTRRETVNPHITPTRSSTKPHGTQKVHAEIMGLPLSYDFYTRCRRVLDRFVVVSLWIGVFGTVCGLFESKKIYKFALFFEDRPYFVNLKDNFPITYPFCLFFLSVGVEALFFL